MTRAVKLEETAAPGTRRKRPLNAASSSQDSCHSGWAASKLAHPAAVSLQPLTPAASRFL